MTVKVFTYSQQLREWLKVHNKHASQGTAQALERAGAQWADLVAQLTEQYPDAAARVFVDILNEPDSFQLQWQAQDDAGLPGAGDLYLAAMDAIYPVNSGEPCWKGCMQRSIRC